jgi:hypothetical protein
MIQAAKELLVDQGADQVIKVYLLLKATAGIYKPRTLPLLLADGVVVQRVPE